MQSEKVASSIDDFWILGGSKSIKVLKARVNDLFFVPTSDLSYLTETIYSVLVFASASLFLLMIFLCYLSISFLLMFSKIYLKSVRS